MLAAERHHVVVAEVVVLHEWNRGLQRFHGFRFMRDHRFDTLFLGRDVLMDDGIRAEPERQTDNQSDRHLSHNLIFALQSFFVATENLDVVVEEAQESKPHGSADHEQQIDVAHTAQQQHGYQNTHSDDDTTHRGHTNFLLSEGVNASVAGGLGNLAAFHVFDEAFAEPSRDEQREDEREQRTERDVHPHARSGNVVLL